MAVKTNRSTLSRSRDIWMSRASKAEECVAELESDVVRLEGQIKTALGLLEGMDWTTTEPVDLVIAALQCSTCKGKRYIKSVGRRSGIAACPSCGGEQR